MRFANPRPETPNGRKNILPSLKVRITEDAWPWTMANTDFTPSKNGTKVIKDPVERAKILSLVS